MVKNGVVCGLDNLKGWGGGGGSSLQPLHVQQAGRTDAVQTMVYAARADREPHCAVFDSAAGTTGEAVA